MPITLYTTTWCGDCRRAKRFLAEHEVEYEEINIEESEEAATLVMSHNAGRRSVPTIRIEDRYYGNPPLNELARLLDIPLW